MAVFYGDIRVDGAGNLSGIIDTESFTDRNDRVPSSHLVKSEIESIKTQIQGQLNRLNNIV